MPPIQWTQAMSVQHEELDRRLTSEFRRFLGYWWQSHILEHDQDYA